MNSLKTRLNFGVFFISLIFFSSLITINIVFFNSFGDTFVQARLQNDMDFLLANLKPDEDGKLVLNESSLNPFFLKPFSGHYFRIEMDHQTYLSPSLWDQDMSVSALNLGETIIIEKDGPFDQKLLILEGAYSKEEQIIRIAVSEDYTPVTDSLRSLTIALVFLNGAIVLLLMLIQRYIVNRSMLPLQKTKEELHLIGAGEKDFLNEAVPEEVRPLVKEINKLMVMVDTRIKRSNTALGNLAHALKTPLSLIEQSVNNIKNNSTAKDIKEAVGQIKYQLDSELKIARIIGSTAHGQKINLKELIFPLINTLEKIYHDKGIHFQINIAEGAHFVGDRHDMMELFGNLLDNACKWAKSEITISITSNDVTEIIIQDDGIGITSEQLAKIEKRGIRLDEAGDGFGLGLSIVREIIDLINAEIQYTNSETLGGLKVIIKIPH